MRCFIQRVKVFTFRPCRAQYSARHGRSVATLRRAATRTDRVPFPTSVGFPFGDPPVCEGPRCDSPIRAWAVCRNCHRRPLPIFSAAFPMSSRSFPAVRGVI
jgi:hypothetical protein